MYTNRCTAKTTNGKRCKRTKSTAEETCIQHISMYPKQCVYASKRFNRCVSVAPYGAEYCKGHQALRIVESVVSSALDEPIIISDSESDSEYVPESDSESETETGTEYDTDDSEWLPYDHKKQKNVVMVEGGGSESVCDCHEDADKLNTAFYDYIEDEENPNVMLILDTLVKVRNMPVEEFNELLDYIDFIHGEN